MGKLIELNERMTERLLEGVSVAGLPDWDQGRSQRVRFIDFDHPERNDFLAVNQFRVDEPGGQAKKFVVPDVVLFVNGIPLVVIECKSPYIIDPMAEGIKQLRRYANQRGLGMAEGQRAAVLDQPVRRLDLRRQGPGRDLHGWARALPGMEGPAPLSAMTNARRARQARG